MKDKKRVKNIFKYLFVVIVIGLATAIYSEVKDPSSMKLRRFRRSNAPFLSQFKDNPSREGLDKLHISGSARLSQPGFRKVMSNITSPIYIFDLLDEPNLRYFIDGMPLRWYGYKDRALEPRGRLELRHYLRRFFRTGKLINSINEIQTEKEIIEALGYHYVGVQLLRRDIPQDEKVDFLVKAFRSLPADRWIHVHCSAGSGRTTVVMTMYDILHNKKLPLEEIVKRQYQLGGVDLFDTTIWKNGTYDRKTLEDRKNFIVNFYEYVNDSQGLGVLTWQEWIKTRSKG